MNMKAAFVLASLAVALSTVEARQCECPNPLLVSTTMIESDNLKEIIGDIILNEYDSAKSILEAIGLNYNGSSSSNYFTNDDPCFISAATKAKVSKDGVAYEANVELSGITFDDRIQISICRCNELSNTGNFCSTVLPDAVKARGPAVKCQVEGC